MKKVKKNIEKMRAITMSSGDLFKAAESKFKKVQSPDYQFGALELVINGYKILLPIPHIAVDILIELPVKNTKVKVKTRVKSKTKGKPGPKPKSKKK